MHQFSSKFRGMHAHSTQSNWSGPNDYLCIVFELLDKSLYDVVSQTERGLRLDDVREYLRQILEALVSFKNSNLIHCDLKPENILVDSSGKNLKLIDFGSAAFNGH